MKNTKLLIFKMEDNMIKCNIYLIRVLEDENKENEVEVLFENFPEMIEDMNPQIQESQ